MLVRLLLALLLCAAPALAEQVRIPLATVEWPPYSAHDLEENGFVAEIVRTAFARGQMDVTLQFFPVKRAHLQAKNGAVAGMFPFLQGDASQDFLLSDPFAGSAQAFFKLRGEKPDAFVSLQDLAGYRVGRVRGLSFSAEFERARFRTKEEATNEFGLFSMLKSGRVDLVIVDKYVADSLFRTAPADFQKSIDQIDPPFSVQPMYVAFSPTFPDAERLRDIFNENLTAMKRDGTVDHIMRRHGYFTISSTSMHPDEVRRIVLEARDYASRVGLARAIEEFNKPDGLFSRGEIYIFMSDFQGLNLAHIYADIRGQNHWDIKDRAGMYFMREFIRTARENRDGGWVEYWWTNPVTRQVQPKRAFVIEAFPGVMMGAGVYK